MMLAKAERLRPRTSDKGRAIGLDQTSAAPHGPAALSLDWPPGPFSGSAYEASLAEPSDARRPPPCLPYPERGCSPGRAMNRSHRPRAESERRAAAGRQTIKLALRRAAARRRTAASKRRRRERLASNNGSRRAHQRVPHASAIHAAQALSCPAPSPPSRAS